jgi:DNA-binding transcriptional LysR family regulator
MIRPEQVSDRLKLPQLKIFLAVATTGSMGKAAKKLAMSQSVVSKAVAELENLLDVRLFDRGALGVEPTPYGKALVRRALAIFDELRTSVVEIGVMTDPGVGEFRIGCTAAQEPVVAAVIQGLLRQYPRLNFKVVVADRATLIDRELRGRQIDLMIAPLLKLVGEEDLESTVLYENQLRVVVSRKSRWARRRKVTLAELIKEPWCLHPVESATGAAVFDAVRASGLSLPLAVVSSEATRLCHRLLADGRFLGISSDVSLYFDRQPSPLVELPVDLPGAVITIAAFTLKNRTISPVARLLLEVAHEVVRPLVKIGSAPRR